MRFLTLTPRIKLPLLSGFSLGVESICELIFSAVIFATLVLCHCICVLYSPYHLLPHFEVGHVYLTATTCSKHFLGKGVGNSICHFTKEGVIAECSWKTSNNEMVLSKVVMKRNLRECLNIFLRKQNVFSFIVLL